MALTRTSAGTMVSGLAAITATYGAGAAAGNLAICFLETANQGTSASGFTDIANDAVGVSGAASATQIDVSYKSNITSGEITSGESVGDGGDHQNAALATYSGYDTTTAPAWHNLAHNGVATTSVNITGNPNGSVPYTNIRAGDILLACIATDRDSATVSTNASPVWANVTGTDNGFIINGSSATGAGGGLIVHELLVTANATATVGFSCTITSSIYAGMIILIKAPTPRFFNRQAPLTYMML